MRKIFFFFTFLASNFAILVVSLVTLTIYTSRQSVASPFSEIPEFTAPESYSSFGTLAEFSPGPEFQLIAGDARVALINNYFQRYRSPMYGLGETIVKTADKYQLPYSLLPAIAQCEGNLGKIMPANSFNPYGFGIYGSLVTRFSSWEEGIETVAKTLRTDYFDQGLDTPDKIMAKYTPQSKGSWSFCVQKFMEEMH